MVCIYCGQATEVINSRLQRRLNQVWRRRKCRSCRNIFTTHEAVSYPTTLVFKDKHGQLQPLERDKLFLSIYASCAHRSTAQTDSTALTNTILGKLQSKQVDGALDRSALVSTVLEVLKRFDKAAAVQYDAYHRSKS